MNLATAPRMVRKTGKLGSAIFSEDGRYRYQLTYRWAPGGRTALFGMQNPSTANADKSDPTVTRCVGFAKRFKCNALVVVNMAAGIATKPANLLKLEDPVGPHNLQAIRASGTGVDVVVAAWGALSPELREIFGDSIRMFRLLRDVRCLGLTKGGDPRHPLYLPSKARRIKLPR